MSRIRSIHPGLWTDEAFVTLSPFARLLFMGIWNECDDMGSFSWSPLTLKMRLLPADNVDALALMEELLSANAVMRYEDGGKSYGAVRNFCQYQRPKKANSTYPQTDEVRNWVNTEARSTRDGSEGVGNQLPTGGEKPRQMEDGGGRRSSEANASGGKPPDSEALFWSDAKAFLKPKVRGDPGALVNKWLRERGKPLTMAALNAAQLEHAVDPIAYCEGYFKRQGAGFEQQPAVPL